MDLRVGKVFGIDGDYVEPDQLLIPLDQFESMDLSTLEQIARRLDLLQSPEVAEHMLKEPPDALISFPSHHSTRMQQNQEDCETHA